MEVLIRKAAVLIEALPFIQRFRGDIAVVKLGGSAMEDKTRMEAILTDITFMECVGMRPVIVHGGGKAISRAMKERGIEPRFIKGVRVTCRKTIQVVLDVIQGIVSPGIAAILEKKGAKARALPGQSILKVTKKTEKDSQTGEILDWGLVGEPNEVDTAPILAMLNEDVIPIITPLGTGPDGLVHNVNADTAAAAVAKALKARKLVLITDVPGLLRDPNDPRSVIETLKASEVDGLVSKGVIDGGMLPKIGSAIEALQAGVRKIHIIDGNMPHSLLLELFTDKGVGTEIIP